MASSIFTTSPRHKIYITYKRKNRRSIKGRQCLSSVSSYKYTYLNEGTNKKKKMLSLTSFSVFQSHTVYYSDQYHYNVRGCKYYTYFNEGKDPHL